jgi:hypothetical protein
MTTVEQLASSLEEDGHAACAEDLVCAVRYRPDTAPAVARRIAECYESDPEPYNDAFSEAMPGELRKWADEQEQQPSV